MNIVFKILILLGFTVIGGVAFLFLSPFLSGLGSAIPSLGDITSQIQPVITYIKENSWQVGSLIAGVGGFVAMISSKIHGVMMQKKEVENTIKSTNLQSDLFQAQGEVLGLQNQLKDAQSQITTLKTNASNVAEITQKLEDKEAEVQTKIAEINQLNRLLENKYIDIGVEQKLEEAKKVE